jgi:hypothetical protein
MSGHIIDMVNRIKQNKVQKRKKFKGDNRVLIHAENLKIATEYEFPVPSETHFKILKAEIQEKARNRQRYSIYILIASFILVALIFLGLYKLI